MNIRADLKSAILDAISRHISGKEITPEDIILEFPDKPEFGEFSTNVAMTFYKEVTEKFSSPRDFANKLVEELKASPILKDSIEKVEIAGPGFINFHLSSEYAVKLMQLIANDIDAYAKPTQVNSKVSIEHTDMNPNKDLHMGHLRNSCLGDSLVRLLRYSGRDVTVQYYQNDAGLQISSIVLAYKEKFVDPKDFPKLHKWAAAAYVDIEKRMEADPALAKKREEIQMNISLQDNEDAKLSKHLTDEILKNVLEVMSGLNIYFDLVVCESNILANKLWEEAFEILKKNKAFYKATEGDKSGCWLIKMPNAEDKIFVRSNGIPNYVATDFAYEMWKYGLLNDFNYDELDLSFYSKPLTITSLEGKKLDGFNQADEVYLVVDTTQSYPQQSIVEALKVLGYKKEAENYKHVAYGFVYLSPKTANKLGIELEETSKPIKMSGRKGTVVSVDRFILEVEQNLVKKFGEFDALKTVRNGAIKFEMLKNNTYQDMVFDLDSAIDNRGFTGPYIQYTYARAMSVIRKSKYSMQDIKALSLSDLDGDLSTSEDGLARVLVKLPEKIDLALKESAPHYLCHYMYELSQAYNLFYNSSPIIGSESEKSRLLLTLSVANSISLGLGLLGIDSPESI